jgi:conjugal transfer pilus assembly protein TraL
VDTDNFVIPKHLDDPPMFLLWDSDEACAFLVPFIGCMMYRSFFIGLGVGLVCMHILGRVKAQGGKQLLKQALYWYTPSQWWFNCTVTPASHYREFIG